MTADVIGFKIKKYFLNCDYYIVCYYLLYCLLLLIILFAITYYIVCYYLLYCLLLLIILFAITLPVQEGSSITTLMTKQETMEQNLV